MKVLIVDDDRDFAESLGLAVEIDGHSFRLALDGKSAILAATADIPDMAIIDFELPDMDGLAVARALRVQCGPRLRLVSLSGYSGPEVAKRAKEAGFDATLVKPLDFRLLDHVLWGGAS